MSSLRRFLAATTGDDGIVERRLSAYRIAAPEKITVDVLSFVTALDSGRKASDTAIRLSLLEEAMALYEGDLLPDTISDWVLDERRSLQMRASDGAVLLGELLLQADRPKEAARAFRSGLRADYHRDDLWRLLIEALEKCHDPAAKALAEARYREVLRRLGVTDLVTMK